MMAPHSRIEVLLFVLACITGAYCFVRPHHDTLAKNYRRSRLIISATKSAPKTASIPNIYSREDGQSAIDGTLMPKEEYGERIGWGRDAQGIGDDTGALKASDPRLSMTYAEFPLPSMDQLIDLGLKYLPISKETQPISFVDIGSGCGRLAFYASLTRGSDNLPWKVDGIEISSLLHGRAVEYMEDGFLSGIFASESSKSCNSVSLNFGPVHDFSTVLAEADIIFAYSTAFPAKDFSPELGALILDPEWSSLLSTSCSAGCIAITTDRALDPGYKWELVGRLDVENPEVFGTSGYVHILRD